jgi:hypothetical protein
MTRSPKVPVQCGVCHSTFLIPRRSLERGRGKYCSRTCRYQGKKVLAVCTWCGTEKRVSPSRAMRPTHYFCSLACVGEWHSIAQRGEAHPQWKGGVAGEAYPREFQRKRQQIMERDNRQCQVCGERPGKLWVHHIDEDPKNNDDKNLVTICPRCHQGPLHAWHTVTFDSKRRAIWVADGSYCQSRWPAKGR